MKSKIILDGNDTHASIPIVGVKRIKSVADVRPVGSQVMVELLTAQELYNTTLHLGTQKVKEGFQGYVRGIGPNLKMEDWGFKVGDRVLISGGGVPVPNYDDADRERVLMEPHSIKGVLVEEE